MAVIYVDGNRFGDLQDSLCRTAESQTAFDCTVKGYRTDMLKSLLEQKVMTEEGWLSLDGRYRFETLLWGGDEFIWVVPAWKGWDVLAFFFRESGSWMFQNEKLTHGAGIVFCHHKAPISRIVETAEALAREAKKKSRSENLFAYQVLESFDYAGHDPTAFRQKILPYGAHQEDLTLPGANMQSIVSVLQKLKEVLPRTKVHELVNLQRTNSANSRHKTIQIEESLMQGVEAAGVKPAFNQIQEYFGKSPMVWFHLIELWDYIVGKEVNDD
jgi:hypothetical protein